MSSWTHVVGNIRVDGIPEINNVEDIKIILGPICTYNNWIDNTKLPCGSEGSLQYEIITYGSGLPWITIPIWGDLRDYKNVAEITEWWEKTLKDLDWVRDAVLQIKVECKEPITLTYSSDI